MQIHYGVSGNRPIKQRQKNIRFGMYRVVKLIGVEENVTGGKGERKLSTQELRSMLTTFVGNIRQTKLEKTRAFLMSGIFRALSLPQEKELRYLEANKKTWLQTSYHFYVLPVSFETNKYHSDLNVTVGEYEDAFNAFATVGLDTKRTFRNFAKNPFPEENAFKRALRDRKNPVEMVIMPDEDPADPLLMILAIGSHARAIKGLRRQQGMADGEESFHFFKSVYDALQPTSPFEE